MHYRGKSATTKLWGATLTYKALQSPLFNIEISIVKLPTIKYLYSVVVDRHIYKSVKDTSGFLFEPKKELFTQYLHFLRSDVFLVIG